MQKNIYNRNRQKLIELVGGLSLNTSCLIFNDFEEHCFHAMARWLE